MKVLNKVSSAMTLAMVGALGVSAVSAADWYAKDNLQPGHDPSMVRFEDGYALMSTNNNLQLWTSEDAYSWQNHKSTVSAIPQWAYQYAPLVCDWLHCDDFDCSGYNRLRLERPWPRDSYGHKRQVQCD